LFIHVVARFLALAAFFGTPFHVLVVRKFFAFLATLGTGVKGAMGDGATRVPMP